MLFRSVSAPCQMGVWLAIAFIAFHDAATAFVPGHSRISQTQSSSALSRSQLCMSSLEESGDVPSAHASFLSRRSLLSTTAAATTGAIFLSTLPDVSVALETSKLRSFQDTDCGFQISIPSDWKQTEQKLPDRRKLLLFQDPADEKTLLFVAYTPIRDDYTSLSSFGTVDQVAQSTILPKGELAGEESKSELLKAESKKNAYFFDYKAEAGGQPLTHFRSVFSLAQGATGGAGAVLVTLTAQTPESRYDGLKRTFDDIMESYGKL